MDDRRKRPYEAPHLRALGTLSGLTMGMNGSCPDGGSRNIDQKGGGLDNDPGDPGTCGSSG